MAMETSASAPAPVRQVALAIEGWVGRLGAVWVEGQLAQVNRRPGLGTVFMTLRDSLADISVPVTASRTLVDSLDPPLVEGASVVVHAKPSYYANRGSLSLQARDIRMVGLGELLARLERRRRVLAAEGLFSPDLKRPLPFLPRVVGLVTAPASAAERDVLDNARRRWPGVEIVVAHATMQGTRAAREVMEALARLDARDDVDVVVIARGGGSVEDLLPFSDEGLVRAVHAARTPVVSAIGHEQDSPLLDLVADVRASTPTDAAKLVVPDVAEELALVATARSRLHGRLSGLITSERSGLLALRSRPALASPGGVVADRVADIADLRRRAGRSVEHRLDRAADDVDHRRARVRALSPLATLRRGYAVVQDADGHVVTSVADLGPGAALSVRVVDGRVRATATAVEPDPHADPTDPEEPRGPEEG